MREHRGSPTATASDAESRLRRHLARLDGTSFPRYRQLLGRHRLREFSLHVDRVPPDPFAGPARIRLSVDRKTAGLDPALVDTTPRRIATEDWLARRAAQNLERLGPGPRRGGPRLQEIGPAVLERSACRVTSSAIELRLLVDLPAIKRRIRARQTETLFFELLPQVATASLLCSRRALEEIGLAVANVEDHSALRRALREQGLVAFLAQGSLLARAGGNGPEADAPRADGQEVPLDADPSLRVSLELPHAGRVEGLGIPAGITVIVGGAFHGKSTLLEAIARGVHPHRRGDGRERVAAIAATVGVRAEDGRGVRQVDISAFLGPLPSGVRAGSFTTERASGSTSQAASIVEAIQAGAKLLLFDEDRCATNFMIRDGRMQRLVPRPAEPIVPFLDRVRELYDLFGVSTILVTGGSGDYLEAADTVIRMQEYRVLDATARAREVTARTRSMRLREAIEPLRAPAERGLDGAVPDLAGLRIAPRGPHAIRAGAETIDLRALDQIVEPGQIRTLCHCLRRAVSHADRTGTLRDLVERIDSWLDTRGLDGLESPVAYDLTRPRSFEIAAALNRWRALRFRQLEEGV